MASAWHHVGAEFETLMLGATKLAGRANGRKCGTSLVEQQVSVDGLGVLWSGLDSFENP
jgi:hypothetical protein